VRPPALASLAFLWSVVSAAAIVVACGGSTIKDPEGDASSPAPTSTSTTNPPPSGAPSCSAPSDCKGILPHQCRPDCATGTGCAHWTCPGGKCVVGYCD